MINPYASWSRVMAAGLDMQQTWIRAVETLGASATVLDARTGLIASAARSPMTADLAELSKMVPEKLEAFGRSGHSVLADMGKIQTAWWAQAQRMGGMMMAGRMLTPAEFAAFAAGVGDYALDSADASARMSGSALAPVHKTATANARRLGRTRSKRKRS
ncbi:hypothetical protein ACFB49_33720 [Sphingomonas sp. DBB INV C78]|uniref:hypothetical protein n=1 Tax=Sphingomonas sp. DBB INV C78 TaxID=3349434 RepID=UPI0036D27072